MRLYWAWTSSHILSLSLNCMTGVIFILRLIQHRLAKRVSLALELLRLNNRRGSNSDVVIGRTSDHLTRCRFCKRALYVGPQGELLIRIFFDDDVIVNLLLCIAALLQSRINSSESLIAIVVNLLDWVFVICRQLSASIRHDGVRHADKGGRRLVRFVAQGLLSLTRLLVIVVNHVLFSALGRVVA